MFFKLNHINKHLYNLNIFNIYEIIIKRIVSYQYYKRYIMKDDLLDMTKKFIKNKLCNTLFKREIIISNNNFYKLKYFFLRKHKTTYFKNKNAQVLSYIFSFLKKFYILSRKIMIFKFIDKKNNIYIDYFYDIWFYLIDNFKYLLLNLNRKSNNIKSFFFYKIELLCEYIESDKNFIKKKKKKKTNNISVILWYKIIKENLKNENMKKNIKYFRNKWLEDDDKDNEIDNDKDDEIYKEKYEEFLNKVRIYTGNYFINKIFKNFKYKYNLTNFKLSILKKRYDKILTYKKYIKCLLYSLYFRKIANLINSKFQKFKRIFKKFYYTKLLKNLLKYPNSIQSHIEKGKLLYLKMNMPNKILIEFYVELVNHMSSKFRYYLWKWIYIFKLKELLKLELIQFYKKRQKYRNLKYKYKFLYFYNIYKNNNFNKNE